MIFSKFKGLQKVMGRLLASKSILSTPYFFIIDSKLSSEQAADLRRQYNQKPMMKYFFSYLQTSSDYFSVYALMREAPFSKHAYEELEEMAKKVKPQSDNLILLRSKALSRIAEHHEDNEEFQEAKKYYWKAVLCMQEAMVPQIVPYYSLYRKYGLLLAKMKEQEEALEVLRESVTILDEFVASSDDPVSSLNNSLRQAQASVKLVQLAPDQQEKWLSLANREWQHCGHNKYEHVEYAETVRYNLIDQLRNKKGSPDQIKLRAVVEMEMFKNPEHAKIIEEIIPHSA